MNSKASSDVTVPYHHGNLRNALIAEGRRALAEIGVRQLSLRYLARKAGVSEAAPSHHFAGKDGLLAAIATEGFKELVAVRRARLSPGMTAETRLLYVMDGYIEFAIEQPALFLLMFGPQIVGKEHYPDLLAAGNASYELLHGAVKDYFDELGVSERFSELKVRCAWSAVHGLSMFYSDRPAGPSLIRNVPFEQWRQGLLGFILTGLTAFDESTLPTTARSAKKGVKSRVKKRRADDTGEA